MSPVQSAAAGGSGWDYLQEEVRGEILETWGFLLLGVMEM